MSIFYKKLNMSQKYVQLLRALNFGLPISQAGSTERFQLNPHEMIR